MSSRLTWILVAVALLGIAVPASAQLNNGTPDELDNVKPKEHLGAMVPLDVPFVDSSGKKIMLKDCFDGSHPVILTMNYSNCPMLCSLQLNGLFETLGKLPWDLGDKYRMVTISIDPKETTKRAESTKEKYLKIYGRPGVEQGWHYVTGTKENIDKVASAVGFGYKYLPKKNQYAHAAVFMVCSPEGKVTRYIYGVKFDDETLRLALVEASQGKIGSTTDRIVLYCFCYDPSKGSYVPSAYKIMRAGGVVVLVLLGGLIGGLVLVRRIRAGRRRAAEAAEGAAT